MSILFEKTKNPDLKKWLYLSLAIIAMALIFQTSSWVDNQQFSVIHDAVFLVVPGFLAVFALLLTFNLTKRRHPRLKPILVFTISILFLLGSATVETFFETTILEKPFLSLSDTLYIISYPFLIYFVLLYLGPDKRFITRKLIAFGLIISIGLLLPTYMAINELNLNNVDSGLLLTLGFPIMDAIIFAVAVIGLMVLFKGGGNYFWIMTLLGIELLVFADTIFLYAEIEGEFSEGHFVNVLYLSRYLFWIFAVFYYNKQITMVISKTGKPSEKFEVGGFRLPIISKLAIPMINGVVIWVTLMVMNNMGLFDYSQGTQNLDVVSISLVIFGIVAVFSAITFAIHSNLNKIVKMQEKEIEQKNKELLKVARFSAIGEVSARLAHDLRNPLSVIKNTVELMMIKHQKDLFEKDQKDFTRLNNAIFRITHQIDDVLDFAKTKPLNKRNYEITKILSKTIETISIPKEVKITIIDSESKVNCDSYHLERVFSNLILNSLQAMKNKGEIKIGIRETPTDFLIEFEDSGPGIPEELSHRVFEPLFTTKQTGTGLGLVSCKNIVEQHDGKLFFKNNPTIFTVQLPK